MCRLCRPTPRAEERIGSPEFPALPCRRAAAFDPGGFAGAVIREAKGRRVLRTQPAYSPELNPQERIWK